MASGKVIYQPIDNMDFFLRIGKPTIKESWQNVDSDYIVFHLGVTILVYLILVL